MAYIGRPLQVANLAVQSGTGDGSDTTPIATLDYATTTNGIAVYLDGVRQLAGTDFNVTAQTTLTFTTAPANGVGVDVYFLGLELSIPTPADATVTTAKIAANAVDETKLKDALVADFTEVVVAAGDSFLLGDSSNSGNTKRDTIQGLLDLVPAGSHPVGARAHLTGSNPSFSNATWTQVAFNTETYDPNGVYNHTSGHDYVVEANGYYLVTSRVYWPGWVDGVRHRMQIYVNGSGVSLALEIPGATKDGTQTTTDILSLSASDSVEIWVYHEKGSAQTMGVGPDASFMAVQRIG
jgi:hypothetical protein